MDMTLQTGVTVQKAETSDKPVVSVVVAAYNASVLLKKALISLQTRSLDASLYEVIVIDDGSVDNTPQMLEGFCESVPNSGGTHNPTEGPPGRQMSASAGQKGPTSLLQIRTVRQTGTGLRPYATFFLQNRTSSVLKVRP